MSIKKINSPTNNQDEKNNFNIQSYFTGIYNILGGMSVLHRKINSRLDLYEISINGVTKNAFEHLANYLNYSAKEMAEILPINVRTIQRYKRNNYFNSEVSDHILQIAEVSAKGTMVFKNKEKFISWINYPCYAFDNKTPISLLRSKFGVDMVLDELGRLEHGIIS